MNFHLIACLTVRIVGKQQEDDSLDFNDEFNGSTVEEMDKFLSEANDKLAEWLQ